MVKMVTEIVLVPVEKLVPNPSNPNEQDDKTFNALCASIQEEGFNDPVQAVPIDDGYWEIVGGEHRWRAAVVLGMPEVPVTPLDGDHYDQDRRDWNLVKMNVLSGKINPQKFTELYNRLRDRYDDESLQALMGFTTSDAFEQMYVEVKSALPPELQAALEDVKDEIKTIDDLSLILNRLFSEYGETLPSNVMAFSWGGRDVTWVLCSDELYAMVKRMMREVTASGGDMSQELHELLTAGVAARQSQGIDYPQDGEEE